MTEQEQSTVGSSKTNEWLTVEEASALSGRSQIAIRALIQSTLEQGDSDGRLKPRGEETGSPFSFYVHRSLIDPNYVVQSSVPEVSHPQSTAPIEQSINSENETSQEIRGEIERLQNVVEKQAEQISALKTAIAGQKQGQPQPENAGSDWLDEAAETKPQQHKEEPKRETSGSLVYLWVLLAVVTIAALGVAYYVLNQMDKLPDALKF